MTRNKKNLPYPFFYLVSLALIIAGLINAGYLLFAHYKNYTDISYSSFCAITTALNCDTVAQSRFSILLNLPIALWGLLAYIFLLAFFVFNLHYRSFEYTKWKVVFGVNVVFVCSSVYFASIAYFKIHAFCPLCLVNYAITLFLLYTSWLTLKRFTKTTAPRSSRTWRNAVFFPFLLVLATLTIATWLWLPRYWQYDQPGITSELQSGRDEDGHYWIGAEHPQLIIEEYTDYQCAACRRNYWLLRKIIAEHPQKIRLVHRHYPLDQEFNKVIVSQPHHTGSGRMSLAALAAGEQGKFWEMNDALYRAMQAGVDSIDVVELAEQLGIDTTTFKQTIFTPLLVRQLQADINEGLQHSITATPTYVIDGKVYTGSLPPETLKGVIK